MVGLKHSLFANRILEKRNEVLWCHDVQLIDTLQNGTQQNKIKQNGTLDWHWAERHWAKWHSAEQPSEEWQLIKPELLKQNDSLHCDSKVTTEQSGNCHTGLGQSAEAHSAQ
jgi:hypothetical protein